MRLVQADAAIEAGERPVWLCTLQLPDGRTLRFATQPIEIDSAVLANLGPFAYEPFLAGMSEFEEEVDVFSLAGVGSLTQAQIEITTTVDLATLHSDWYHVTGARIELALIWPGQRWEDRQVVLGGGTVQGASFGLVGQSTTLSVEAAPPTASATIGDDTRDVGADYPAPRFDTGGVDEISDLKGSKYQHVYGAATNVPGYKVGDVDGLNRLIIAGHHFARTGSSYPITVYVDGVFAGTFDVVNAGSGATAYAYVESLTQFLASQGAYTYTATYGGIAAADGVDRAALGAGGIMRRLLADTGLPVSWRDNEPALAKLADWSMGFALTQETLAVDALRELAELLPVIEMTGGAGMWFHYCDPHQAPIEAALTLGQELLGRIGPMEISDLEAIRNEFVCSYDYDGFTGEHLAAARLDGSNSTICYLSQQLYGVRADDPIDTDTTSDAATAGRIMLARADRLALPRRILTYALASDAYWLTAGAVVALTDPGYGISAHRGVITKINRAMAPFQAVVELIDRSSFSRE